MTGRPNTQAIVFGGLMAALTIALAAPLGPLLPSVLALPVALAYARHGPRSALWTALVSAGGCLMFYDVVTVVAFIIPSGILAGVALGWGAWNQRPALQTVGLATAANVAGYVADWYLGLLVLHQNPSAQYQTAITGLLNQMRGAGPQMAPAVEFLEPYLRRGVAASAVMYSLFMAVAAYVIALIIFRRLGHPLVPPPPLARLRLPAWTAALFALAFGVTRLTVPGRVGPLLQGGAINLSLLLYPLFIAQGLLVAGVLAGGAGLGRPGVIVVAILVMVFGVAIFLGLADSLLDLRRRA